MYKQLAKLVIYRDMTGDSILSKLGEIFEDFDKGSDSPEHLKTRIFVQIRRLLELATQYGFDKNLWHAGLLLLHTALRRIQKTCRWQMYLPRMFRSTRNR